MAETTDRGGPDTRSRLREPILIGAALSLVWVCLCIGFLIVAGGDGADPLRAIMAVLAICLPVGLIWLAVLVVKAQRDMAREIAALRDQVEALHRRSAPHVPAADPGASEIGIRLDQIADAQRKTELTLSRFLLIRPQLEGTATSPAGDQTTLALDEVDPPPPPPLELDDVITALHFPADPDDKAGFRALRRALQDRHAAQLVTAAQDVLTLLSQDGIYMDDLRPDRARVETWRSFARGERGRAIADLGGIRERMSLSKVATRMRQDTIFRDACHHFLRLFDHLFAEIEEAASDAQIAELADTRSARAFMLLGRVAGTFD